jgi:competence protein ComEA
MGWLQKHRGYFVLTLAYLALAGVGIVALRWPRPEPITIVAPTPSPAPTVSEAPLQVHVTGAVLRPGVYCLSPDSRLVHAVSAAGGMAPDADEERINLADRLVDGQQVYVPRRGAAIPPSPTPASRTAGAASRAAGANVTAAEVVNINTASAAELETLPGIGPSLAQRIIEHREAHGPFADPAEIMAVSGIGEATFAKIADRIVVH